MNNAIWIVLVIVIVIGVLNNFLKKTFMNAYSFSLSSITNPVVISTLFLAYFVWILELWMFSIERGTIIVGFLYGAGILILIISAFVFMHVLREVTTTSQMLGLGILIGAGVLSAVGLYLLGVNV